MSNQKLVFHFDLDPRTAEELEAKGFLEHCHVELADGTIRPVTFYDPVRLAQDLEEEAKRGKPFLAEKRLIVLTSVTRENMETAIERCAAEGFFEQVSSDQMDMTESELPTLQFDCPFDERTAWEAEARGCWSHSHVEFPDGRRYSVHFYDAVRLSQELAIEVGHGRPFIAERNMIVLTDVTRTNMENAVSQLAKEGFFLEE